MQVRVFVTDGGHGDDGAAPMLIIGDGGALPILPDHPHGRRWRYFATLNLEDQMFYSDRAAIEGALAAGRPCVIARLVG